MVVAGLLTLSLLLCNSGSLTACAFGQEVKTDREERTRAEEEEEEEARTARPRSVTKREPARPVAYSLTFLRARVLTLSILRINASKNETS